MLRIENESSLKAALRKDVNIFVGAGFSVLAKDKTGKNLPTGAELVEELCNKFGQPSLASQALPLVSQIIKSKDRAKFNDHLKERFKVGEYDDRYNCISTLGISRVFTTNIDDLFSKIYSISSNKYLNDLILQGATFRDSAAVEYLPLHGSISYPDPDFTFTPIEIATAFANNPTQFQYLVSCLNKSPTVFLGYSLQDAGALQSLNATFTNGTQEKPRWIQLRESDDAAEAYFKTLGFNIIIGDTDSILDFFCSQAKNISASPALQNQKLSQASFGSGKIPTLQEAAVRPITDFFKGHAPVWHDILARRIYITKSYRTILDHIDADRNVLITGIPVSGKSTLLMQAAAYCDTHKVKLFEDVITPEKAEAIQRISSGKGDVLLFIDNVGDSVDALNILASSRNIQVVAADRSVNIGFGSHRFNSRNFVNVDCSDLDDSDFPKIYESIPPAIRNEKMEMPEVEADYRPSAFEFIEKNVNGQKISDRYRDVLRKLRSDQIETHDLFVMICYVFSCHAPVSFDVVSRFIGASGDWKQVYKITEKLGRLLSEIDSSDSQFFDLDDSQDYFTPRSNLVSETVVQMCRNEDFRRIYLRFHSSVPRLFIPRYSNFRRYGYRSGFVDRVFQDWREGEDFYLRSYSEDKSYFLKQQLAIFLGSRKQFEIAFKYIDEALTESRSKNPNIRHTHARLLFDANIDKAAVDPTLKGHLIKSMEILEACHEYDQRQTNHALRFAEQSIKYSSVFPGPDADEYKSKAKRWLKEEVEKMPFLRHAKSLIRQLDR